VHVGSGDRHSTGFPRLGVTVNTKYMTATFISIDPKKKKNAQTELTFPISAENYHAITVADVADVADEPTADAADNLAEITNLSSA